MVRFNGFFVLKGKMKLKTSKGRKSWYCGKELFGPWGFLREQNLLNPFKNTQVRLFPKLNLDFKYGRFSRKMRQTKI